MSDSSDYRTTLQNLLNKVTSIFQSGGYRDEFDELKKFSDKLHLTAKREDGWEKPSRCKNRYKDILPYDEFRVRLPEVNSIPGSDYINASYIEGPQGYYKYIAAQGPLPGTIFDFWRMVWYEHVTAVIMLCKEIELGRAKCSNYWGKEEGDKQVWGNFSVTLVSVDEGKFYTIRKLLVSCGNVSREVYQYHYLKWPDRDVPTDAEPVHRMLTLVREQCPENLKGLETSNPVVVHCSAGCGRTGTVMSIDCIDIMIKHQLITPEFTIQAMVQKMRQQRMAICQTSGQYGFVYSTAIKQLTSAVEAIDKRTNAAASESLYMNLPPNKCQKEKKLTPPIKPPKPTRPESIYSNTPAASQDKPSEPVYATIDPFSKTGILVQLDDPSSDEPPPLPPSLDLTSESEAEVPRHPPQRPPAPLTPSPATNMKAPKVDEVKPKVMSPPPQLKASASPTYSAPQRNNEDSQYEHLNRCRGAVVPPNKVLKQPKMTGKPKDDDEDSERSFPHSDIGDSNRERRFTSSDGENQFEEGDGVYETFGSPTVREEDVKHVQEEDVKHVKSKSAGKRFNFGGLRNLKDKVSDTAHSASQNLKHFSTGITTHGASHSTPSFQDLPSYDIIEEFGKRPPKPKGPRDMPSHWVTT